MTSQLYVVYMYLDINIYKLIKKTKPLVVVVHVVVIVVVVVVVVCLFAVNLIYKIWNLKIDVAKVIRRRKCHFGATYIDGMTSDPLFILDIQRGLKMKSYARFDEILNAGYFLNGNSILDVTFTNHMPISRHLCGRNDW